MAHGGPKEICEETAAEVKGHIKFLMSQSPDGKLPKIFIRSIRWLVAADAKDHSANGFDLGPKWTGRQSPKSA